MPKLGKAHSSKTAQKFICFGWTLKHDLRAADDDEPYEYIFEWEKTGDPPTPSPGNADRPLMGSRPSKPPGE